jgi:hypothetical protein
MDKFPEAFRRFERKVNVRKIETFRQLTLAFGSWAGEKWHGTFRQMEALSREAERIGLEVPRYYEVNRSSWRRGFYGETSTITWRYEVVTVQGKSQNRYRDLKTGRFVKKP